jgi:hypothetical protein
MREDNIKIDVKVGIWGLNSCGSEWGIVSDSCVYGQEPSGTINAANFLII